MVLDIISLIEGVIILIVAAILLSGIKIVKEWERVPILRLGRYIGLKGPGIIYVIPFIDKVPMRISTRLDTIPFRSESTLTADNVPVNVDAVMYFRPVDVEKCVLYVENYLQATQWAAQTTLREVIGKIELNELLSEREKVGAHLREIIDEKTEAWGVKVTAVEIKDVIIPSELQDAMSRQAQAERERMARVTLATAEYQAARKMIEAAKLYEKSPHGLMLRWMNILYELGHQPGTNTIMLIPSQIPQAGVPPIGIFGFKPLTEEKKAEASEKPEEKPEETTETSRARRIEELLDLLFGGYGGRRE
ncbi:MAG: slipin family protein [Candidatus Methanomethylicota archaeon]|nr:MAG: slipin family protein [Candidatus Verstraetearchaeota archaeon]